MFRQMWSVHACKVQTAVGVCGCLDGAATVQRPAAYAVQHAAFQARANLHSAWGPQSWAPAVAQSD